jgi:uncharacterized coiled-coil DUF342 family protein
LGEDLENTRKKRDEIFENLVKAEAYIEKCEQEIEKLKQLVEDERERTKELLSNQEKEASISNRKIEDELRSAFSNAEG